MTPERVGIPHEHAEAHAAGDCLEDCPHPDHLWDGLPFDLGLLTPITNQPEVFVLADDGPVVL